MALECSIPLFLLQPLEGQVITTCPVPCLEGLPGANLDFLEQHGRNSLQS